MYFIIAELPRLPDHIPATSSRHPAAVYTVRDVAAHLRCSNQHVLDLINRGQLRAVREGNRWLVLPADLDAYLASLRTAKESTPQPLPIRIGRDRGTKKTG